MGTLASLVIKTTRSSLKLKEHFSNLLVGFQQTIADRAVGAEGQ